MRISSFYPFDYPGVEEADTWFYVTDELLLKNVDTFVSMLRAGEGFRNIVVSDDEYAGPSTFKHVSYEVLEELYHVDISRMKDLYKLLEKNEDFYLIHKESGLWLEPIE